MIDGTSIYLATVEIKDLSAEDLAWWLRNMQPIIPSYDSKKIARWYEIQNKFHEYGAQVDEQLLPEPTEFGAVVEAGHKNFPNNIYKWIHYKLTLDKQWVNSHGMIADFSDLINPTLVKGGGNERPSEGD